MGRMMGKNDRRAENGENRGDDVGRVMRKRMKMKKEERKKEEIRGGRKKEG